MNNTVHNRIFRIARREVFRIATRPLYLFCMIIAPLFCYLFFTTLMWNGLPTDMPAGVVDLDNTEPHAASSVIWTLFSRLKS